MKPLILGFGATLECTRRKSVLNTVADFNHYIYKTSHQLECGPNQSSEKTNSWNKTQRVSDGPPNLWWHCLHRRHCVVKLSCGQLILILMMMMTEQENGSKLGLHHAESLTTAQLTINLYTMKYFQQTHIHDMRFIFLIAVATSSKKNKNWVIKRWDIKVQIKRQKTNNLFVTGCRILERITFYHKNLKNPHI